MRRSCTGEAVSSDRCRHSMCRYGTSTVTVITVTRRCRRRKCCNRDTRSNAAIQEGYEVDSDKLPVPASVLPSNIVSRLDLPLQSRARHGAMSSSKHRRPMM